jgi:hypothetical protein
MENAWHGVPATSTSMGPGRLARSICVKSPWFGGALRESGSPGMLEP